MKTAEEDKRTWCKNFHRRREVASAKAGTGGRRWGDRDQTRSPTILPTMASQSRCTPELPWHLRKMLCLDPTHRLSDLISTTTIWTGRFFPSLQEIPKCSKGHGQWNRKEETKPDSFFKEVRFCVWKPRFWYGSNKHLTWICIVF